ncbi:MAG: hypothetical protein ACFFCH_10725 [Promethearchaeota archaeon]
MNGSKDWVFIAVILVFLGYFLPMCYITVPTLTIHWIDSLLIAFLATPSIGTPSFVWWLIPIPLVFAIIGWAGFSYRSRLAFLRIGFYPTSCLVILLLIISVYLALMSTIDLFIPVNAIAFTFAALAAHQAKNRRSPLLEEKKDNQEASQ